MTILNAVALGGGYTYRANKELITLIRSGSSERDKMSVGPETRVLPGDVVRIEERFDVSRYLLFDFFCSGHGHCGYFPV